MSTANRDVIWGQGDIVAFPHGDRHSEGDGEAEPVPLATLVPRLPWQELPVIRHGGNGERTHVICVYLRFDPLLFEPFLASLPRLLVVRHDRGRSSQWLDANLRYLVEEAAKSQPGTAGMIARLTELVFIEMLRLHMARMRDEEVGWFAALNDRYVSRALDSFHRRPADPWTVETLAREVGLSRSALVRRFDRLLGMSPIHYLTIWRLRLAAQALRTGRDSVAAIAEQVGYASEEGFSRAFKRCFGSSPAAWRQSQD